MPNSKNRRDFLKSIGLMGLGLSTLDAATVVGGVTEGKSPNVVLIFSDDQGFNDCEVNSHSTPVATPNLRRLAEDGVTFTQGYACASMCTPSRVGMLSGRNPARFGVYDVGGDSAFTWPRERKIIPQYLKKAGYATACIGKWHCGGDIEEWGYNHPLERGFDRFWGFMGSTHDYWKKEPGSGFNGAGYVSCGYQPVRDQEEVIEALTYLTRDITRESVQFIKENQEQPFFLYVAHHCPHVPLQAPKNVHDSYLPLGLGRNTTLTRAMQEVLDDGLGAILDTLDACGIADNTLVIYSSDNGGGERSGQLNWVYRGGKFTMLEGGIRVPMLMRWPGRIPADRVYDYPVQNIDFMPTILSATGIQPEQELDGVDLLPYLRAENTAPPHEALFWKNPESMHCYAVRSGDWKLVYSRIGRGLFNLREDPGETKDLRKKHPEIAARLQSLYDEWDRGQYLFPLGARVPKEIQQATGIT